MTEDLIPLITAIPAPDKSSHHPPAPVQATNSNSSTQKLSQQNKSQQGSSRGCQTHTGAPSLPSGPPYRGTHTWACISTPRGMLPVLGSTLRTTAPVQDRKGLEDSETTEDPTKARKHRQGCLSLHSPLVANASFESLLPQELGL